MSVDLWKLEKLDFWHQILSTWTQPKSSKLKSSQYFGIKNKFHWWSEIFYSFLKKVLLKIGPNFVSPTDTSYFIRLTWNFSNNLILWKQKCLSLDQQYLWHLQDHYAQSFFWCLAKWFDWTPQNLEIFEDPTFFHFRASE